MVKIAGKSMDAASIFPNLLTFSAVGFTVFVSGSLARYTILQNVKISSWYYKIFLPVIQYLIIPGVILALSPVLILYSYVCGDTNWALWGFWSVFIAYVIAFLIMPIGFFVGYSYYFSEEHFRKKFRKQLHEKGLTDFENLS